VWVGIEPFMRGTYRKHNNNNGFVLNGESKLQLDTAETRCTPQAFLHFTFHFSSGNLIVCDIQGVGDVYTDVYTDPRSPHRLGKATAAGTSASAALPSA
jgi:hypothetical protein